MVLASHFSMQQTVRLAFVRQPVTSELVSIMFIEVLVSCLLRNMHSSNCCCNFFTLILSLKLVSAIFYQIFIFSPNDSPLKVMKNVFYFI